MKVNRLKKSTGAKVAIAMGASLTLTGLSSFALAGSPRNLSQLDAMVVDPVSSTLYVVTGLLGLFAGACGRETSRAYFRFCGGIYGILALMALFYIDKVNFGWLTNDAFHAVLHFAVAACSLLFGFGTFVFHAPHFPIGWAGHRHVVGYPHELIHH